MLHESFVKFERILLRCLLRAFTKDRRATLSIEQLQAKDPNILNIVSYRKNRKFA